MRKWIPAFLVLCSYLFAAASYVRLPEEVTLRWDLLIAWGESANVEPLPRAVAAFGFPTVAMAVWLLLTGVASSTGERLGRRIFPAWLVSPKTGAEAVKRFAPTFELIVTAVVALVLLLHAVMLGTAAGERPGSPGSRFRRHAR